METLSRTSRATCTSVRGGSSAPDGAELDLAALYSDHFEQLLAVALPLVDTRSHAEEAVQDAFGRLSRRISEGPVAIEYPLAYLRVVVLNVARGSLRRRQIAERYMAHQEAPVGPEEIAERAEERRLVREACAVLSPQQRAVVELRYWQDLSESEIAQKLEISPGSVKTHAARARQTLRRTLVKNGVGSDCSRLHSDARS